MLSYDISIPITDIKVSRRNVPGISLNEEAIQLIANDLNYESPNEAQP